MKHLLPAGKFRRGFVLLAGGNGLGQMLALLASPILTRLYTPADFGVLAVYMSITAILGVTLALRYENAIALPESEKESLAIVYAGLCFVVMNAVLGLIVIIFFREQIASLLNTPALSSLLFLLPASMLLFGGFKVCRMWCLRVGEFARIGKARLFQVICSLIIQISGATFGSLALLLGQVANHGAGVFSLGRVVKSASTRHHIGKREMLDAVRRYKRFPLFSSWSALMNRTSAQLPTLVFAVFFGPVNAGLYALAARVLNTPSSMFGDAIAGVFLSTAAERARAGTLAPLLLRTFRTLLQMAMPACILIAILAPETFRIAFGAEWTLAGRFAQWMSILVCATIVVSPLGSLFSILERQKHEMLFQTTLLIARLISISIGAWQKDALLAIALYSIVSAFCYSGMVLWLFRQLDLPYSAVLKVGVSALGASMLIGMPALVGTLMPGQLSWFAGAGLSAVLVALWVWRQARPG